MFSQHTAIKINSSTVTSMGETHSVVNYGIYACWNANDFIIWYSSSFLILTTTLKP